MTRLAHDEIDAEVGRLLRRARMLRFWTLQKAEDASEGGLKASTIASYERGYRRLAVAGLFELADLYGLPVTSLLPLPTSGDQVIDLAERINRLPASHRDLLNALVEQMYRDTQAVSALYAAEPA